MASRLGDAFGRIRRGISARSPTTTTTTPSDAPRAAPSRDSTLAGAVIEYNPDLDGSADPGEVVWTWVPWEEDPSQGKDRPVVIVGQRKGMLIGVPLTSRPRRDEAEVAVGSGPWDRDGRQSYAKLDRVLEVDPDRVRREGAILARAQFDEVIAALQARKT